MKNNFKKYILLICVIVLSLSTFAQIKVINNKGTFFQIDTSKWSIIGLDIYNKNTNGNVGIGAFPYGARLVVHSSAVPAFKLKYPFTGAISDSILTWNPIDSTVRKITLLNLLTGNTIRSLNGLTVSTQTFATGTDGTDFNIVSSGSTHTFNFPNATSTSRGLLTAADWITFNNKISSITATTAAARTVAGTTVNINNTGPYWNADQLQGRAISTNAPNSGQVLVWNGTSWAPSSVASGTTTVSNTVDGFQFTTTVNGVTGSPVSLPFAGVGVAGLIALNCDLTGDVWCPRIAPSAVNSDKIQDGEVKTADLAWGAVTTDKLAFNSVTYDRIQQMPGQTLLGNPYSSTGNPLAINIGTGLSFNGTTLNATGASWSLVGNAGTNPSTNFLGTTDYNRLIFKTDNVERATFLPTGYFGLGITNPSATFHNNGTTVFSVRTISNRTSSGVIESAESSVDIGTNFAVNQTTPGLNFTLPWTATAGKMVKISNSGTAAFTMYNTVIAPSKFAEFMWTGSTWIPMTGGSSSVVNKKLVLSAEYAGAVVTPGNATPSHNGDLYRDNTGSTGPYSYYYMNYYEWKSTNNSGTHSYQIIVRVTLPNDFTEWQTTNAIQYVYMAQSTCSVEFDMYNVTTNAQIYNGSTLTSGSWTTTDIPGSSLTNWVTPGQTVAIVITMRASTNGKYARIGDIILNYK